MMRALRHCSAITACLAVILVGCSGDDPVASAADAICVAIDGEPSDEVAFEEYELALARERREGLDEDELHAALDERCGRAIAAISAAAEEPDPTDLATVDWTGMEWSTVCTEDRSDASVQLTREDGQGVWRSVADSPTPSLHVPLDDVLHGDVNGDGLDDAIFVVECVFSGTHAEHFIEAWSHDEQGAPVQLETVASFTREEGVINALEIVDDRLRIHTAEGRDGDNQPHINGYPIEVVTDWHHDGNGWVDDEISRIDTTPEPEPEAEPGPEPEPEPSSGVGECEGAGSSPESAAMCLYAAARDGNLDAAREVAGPDALAGMRELIDYWGEEYEWAWEFRDCDGDFVQDLRPPFDVACHFYAPASDPNYHGTFFEFRLNLIDGLYFVEQTEGFG